MTHYKYFLIIIFVVTSCVKNKKLKKEFNLEGSWSVIDKDSTYYEAFYNDSTYHYYFGDDDYLSSPTKYKIKGDTLFAFRKEDSKEKAYINFIEKKRESYLLLRRA